MRRFYNSGTGYLETITKGTPIGAVRSIVKKIKKNKEDKKSRNPDPKTPKMMGTEKDLKKERQMSKFKEEVLPKSRSKRNLGDNS